MSAKEAIEILNDMKGVFGTRGHSQYSLNAIDKGIEALKKQIKKPKEYYNWCDLTTEQRLESAQWYCRKCHGGLDESWNYCACCGQEIDWS